MAITVETTTVFKTSNGRRYMTKKAAMMREAFTKLKRKYEPEGHEPSSDGNMYLDHDYYTDEQWTKFKAVANRYYRIFRNGVR